MAGLDERLGSERVKQIGSAHQKLSIIGKGNRVLNTHRLQSLLFVRM